MTSIECSICLSEICDEEGKHESSIKLKCGHTFHKKCIKDWNFVSKNSKCPYCRSDFSIKKRHINKLCVSYSKKFIHTNIKRYFSGKIFKYSINSNNSGIFINVKNSTNREPINYYIQYDNLISIIPYIVSTNETLGNFKYKIFYKIIANINGIDKPIIIPEMTRCIILNLKVLFQSREIRSKFEWKNINEVLKSFTRKGYFDDEYLELASRTKEIEIMIRQSVDCFTILGTIIAKYVPDYINLLTNTNFICMLNDIYTQRYAKVEYLDHKYLGKHICLLFMLNYLEYDTTSMYEHIANKFDKETFNKEYKKFKKQLSYSRHHNLIPLRIRYNEK